MSKLISQIRDLGQKAMAMKDVLDQTPETIAGIRQTFAETTDQLQQLRSEVRDTAAELKADPEMNIEEAIKEINASEGLLRQAGVEVTGVDLEIKPVKRLVVHLKQREQVAVSATKDLLAAHPDKRILQLLLSAMEQIEPVLRSVRFDRLEVDELLIVIGAVPSVCVCWHSIGTSMEHGSYAGARPTGSSAQTSSPVQTTFFEKRTASPIHSVVPDPQPAVATPLSETGSPKREIGKWTSEALDRFKKMPSLSKYS